MNKNIKPNIAKTCEKEGHRLSERRLKNREGMVFAEYSCLRCGQHYQETPTASEMERYHQHAKELFG